MSGFPMSKAGEYMDSKTNPQELPEKVAHNSLGLFNGLGTKEKSAIFSIQTEVLRVMVNKLIEKGFRWILPVMLSRATDPLWPDPGASIEKRIELSIYGQNVKTMQSMILHKRVLVSLGAERFFILSPNIRIENRERAKTGKHLFEFNQLEVEVAYGKMEHIFRLFEELIQASALAVNERLREELRLLGRNIRIPTTPFKVYGRSQLEERFGQSWTEAVAKQSENPVWVIDLPREFYDYQEENSGTWRNFDLILPEGFGEVISGAEREYEYRRIAAKLESDGLDQKDYQLMLRLAKDGLLKPSAGAGLGVERFVSYICGTDHVGDVQPFPRIPGLVPDL